MFFFFFFKQNTAYEMRISDGSSDVCSSDLLVLVNGRRFIPANADGSVDLATIPDALVERVEIITGGASAVYGSDAIAGAVNFILKDDFDGLETSYQYGQTFRDDGAAHKVDATFGANLAGGLGKFTLSASYTKLHKHRTEERPVGKRWDRKWRS